MDKKQIEEFYHDLIKTYSVSGHEKEMAHKVGDRLEKIGLKPTYSHYKDMVESECVYATLDSGKPGKTMLLIGHLDTVDFGEGWDTDPLTPTVVGDKTYGRGAMDMKGGVTAILETVEYFYNHKDEFNGKIQIAFVADEEVLSRGTYHLVEKGVLNADYAIMGECRFDNVAIAFRGRLVYDVTVHGVSAHSKDYPNKGVNAIILAGKLAEEIEKLPTLSHPQLKSGTWIVRHIEGGPTGTLIVPESCYMLVERYVVPGENEESCKKQIEEAVKKAGLEGKVDVCLRPRDLPYMKSFAIPEDHELVKSVLKHYKDIVGTDLKLGFDLSVCDSNILAVELGIPVITFGPSGGNMHGANEWGVFSHVLSCIEIYKNVVKDMLK